MPESYQVMKADFARILPPKDNWPEKHVYSELLDPLDGGTPIEAEEFRHPKAAPPQQGEHVEGEITKKGNFPFTFKRAKAPTESATPSSASPKASDGRDSFRKHPAEVAGARRAHAQEVAVYYAAVLQKAHPDLKPDWDWLEGIIGWFDEDARKASEKA